MAAKATIYKAELQVTDLDRHYYASHALTLAQHPSETETRLLVRLLAFALHADKDPVDALKAFEDFAEVYQASADEPLPLFRRRA